MLACCRRHEPHFVHDAVREAATALADHCADPRGPDRPFDGDRAAAAYARIRGYASADLPDPVFGVTFGVLSAVKPATAIARANETLTHIVYCCLHDLPFRQGDAAVAAERAAQAVLVREVLGNPFRPVAFSPEWRTDTVLALARQMYSTEDFGAMPILADALQDAGCDNAEVLNHCREEGATHVRGCWALDRILGKE
jgi:hypothetical protein